MRLDRMTWPQAEAEFARQPAVFLPIGSTEQHGPMGLIGTDAICAEAVAFEAASRVHAVVLPPIVYTPAPFNMGFAGTVSVSPAIFAAMVEEVIKGIARHGVRGVYVVNAHGANLAPLEGIASSAGSAVRIRNWWDFDRVGVLRLQLYGAHEGMHATPSETAMTMAVFGPLAVPSEAKTPPAPLPDGFIAAHSGDRHGSADDHRAQFPDGRVGSHSALANVEDGKTLLDVAAAEVAADFQGFVASLSNAPSE